MSDIAVIDRPDHGPLIALIDKAIDKGLGADELGKLVALAEHMAARRAESAYSQAMNRVQAAMPAVVKDAQNKHTNSPYARLESLTAAITPVYTREGFSLSFDTADSPLPGHMRVVCDCLHSAGHRERKHLDLPIDGAGAKGGASSMNAVQAHGSTTAYGRRYLSAMVFNLVVAGQDTDAAGYGRGGDAPAGQRLLMRDLTLADRQRVEAEIAKWDEAIKEIEYARDAEALNNLVPKYKALAEDADPVLRLAAPRAWARIAKCARELGLRQDREAGRYVPVNHAGAA